MKRERVCSGFPKPYYLHHSDKFLKNDVENMIHVFEYEKITDFKIALIP